jgi:predicted nucleic acid-binding Zn finger protein
LIHRGEACSHIRGLKIVLLEAKVKILIFELIEESEKELIENIIDKDLQVKLWQFLESH